MLYFSCYFYFESIFLKFLKQQSTFAIIPREITISFFNFCRWLYIYKQITCLMLTINWEKFNNRLIQLGKECC